MMPGVAADSKLAEALAKLSDAMRSVDRGSTDPDRRRAAQRVAELMRCEDDQLRSYVSRHLPDREVDAAFLLDARELLMGLARVLELRGTEAGMLVARLKTIVSEWLPDLEGTGAPRAALPADTLAPTNFAPRLASAVEAGGSRERDGCSPLPARSPQVADAPGNSPFVGQPAPLVSLAQHAATSIRSPWHPVGAGITEEQSTPPRPSEPTSLPADPADETGFLDAGLLFQSALPFELAASAAPLAPASEVEEPHPEAGETVFLPALRSDPGIASDYGLEDGRAAFPEWLANNADAALGPPCAPPVSVEETALLPALELDDDPLPFRGQAPPPPLSEVTQLPLQDLDATAAVAALPDQGSELPFARHPRTDLDRYVELCAAEYAHPQTRESIWQRFAIGDDHERRALEASWCRRFDAKPELRARFAAALARHRRSVR
jgi:hypothetical protein